MPSTSNGLGAFWRLLLILLVLFPPPLLAATITVTDSSSTIADDGACSLREAVTAANTNTASGVTAGECPAGEPGLDTIELTEDVFLTISDFRNRRNGLPMVTEDLIVAGNGFTIERSVEDPEDELFRFFEISGAGLELELQDVTLTKGHTTSGGAISVTDGAHVTLRNSTLINNRAIGDFDKGGGGLIAINASVSVYASRLIGNEDQSSYYPYDGGGGIQGRFSNVIIDQSTLSNNDSRGNLRGGGINMVGGTLTLTNSTLSGNTAGAITATDNASLNVTNTTFSKNDYALDLEDSTGSLKNVTIFDGGPSVLPAVPTLRFDNSASFSLENTLLANSIGNHCTGAFTDGGGNLADSATCGTIPATLVGLDTELLQNGGPTPTHALLPGSSALDAAGACGLPTDQRGEARDSTLCDSGAFEGLKTAPAKIFAADDRGNRDTQVLSIDPSSSSDTSIGPVQSLVDLETLAYDRTSDRLYGITAETGDLWEVDTTTGALSLICTIDTVRKFREIASSSFHPVTGELWAYQYNRGLVTIDLEDCSLTREWRHAYGNGTERKWDAIAWAPDASVLYATERVNLLRWEPLLEDFFPICSTLPDKTEGLEFSPTGQFLGSSGSQIFEVGPGCNTTLVYDLSNREDIESLTFE